MGKKSKAGGGGSDGGLEDLSEWRQGFTVDLSLQRRDLFPFNEFESNQLITTIGTYCSSSLANSGPH